MRKSAIIPEMSDKESFVEKLKDKIKNATTKEDKDYYISVGENLFFDWTYKGEE